MTCKDPCALNQHSYSVKDIRCQQGDNAQNEPYSHISKLSRINQAPSGTELHSLEYPSVHFCLYVVYCGLPCHRRNATTISYSSRFQIRCLDATFFAKASDPVPRLNACDINFSLERLMTDRSGIHPISTSVGSS